MSLLPQLLLLLLVLTFWLIYTMDIVLSSWPKKKEQMILKVCFWLSFFLHFYVVRLRWSVFNFLFLVKLHVEALVMSERIETVVPAIYMICVLMGWFGPNGTILGNIKLTIWHYAAIEDFQAFLNTISIFLFVDFMSFVANGILLWCTVKINIFKTLQMLQRDFWLVMAIFECALFVEVTLSISNVNWAMHSSTQFF